MHKKINISMVLEDVEELGFGALGILVNLSHIYVLIIPLAAIISNDHIRTIGAPYGLPFSSLMQQ